MRELVRYTCATCGGALIVNRSEEVFKCPFCGNGFDAAKMHKREILNDAETNMKQMEFNAAKDKFDSILKSEPQDFDALKGIVLCAGKLRSLESFQSMDRIRSCEWTGMVNELTDVKKRAKKEDVPFFTRIGELLVTIEEQTRLQSELTNAENKSKNEIAKQNQTEESGRGLLCFFMFLFILLILGVFVSGTPVSGIYCGIGCAVLFIIFVVLVKVTGHFGSNSHKKKLYYIRKELIETRKKLDEIENKYDNYYRELLLMDHSGSDKQAPVYSSLQDYSEEQGMDNSIKVICTQCGAELLPDKENKIYRCTHCGVSYGSSVIFDRDAASKARKSLAIGEFNDADIWYKCILMTCSYDFEALRGRILCAGKWKSFNDVEVPSALSTVRIKNVRERAEEGKLRALEKDKEFFLLCIKLINTFELLWKKETEIKPVKQKWEHYKRYQDIFAEYIVYEPLLSYSATQSTTKDLDRKLKPLIEERDKIKKDLFKVRKAITDFENNRGKS